MSKETLHQRRLREKLKDPNFASIYRQEMRQIEAVDRIVNSLDARRDLLGLTKGELARLIGKHPASIRRLLTTSGNPELRTIVALTDALDADLQVVPRKHVN